MSVTDALPPPPSWFLLCRSDQLRRGQVRSVEFLSRPMAVFRGESGQVYALSAHCSHLGTHLGQGKVTGDRLKCPLHHWEYDGQGVCRHIPASAVIPEHACQASFPVLERYGMVWLFNGLEPTFAPPSFPRLKGAPLRALCGKPVPLACAWEAVFGNAFDLQHLERVHGRKLKGPTSLSRPEPHRLEFRYISRVTDNTPPDRVMRWLSKDHIDVSINCWGGSLLTVESDLGRVRSALLLGIMPTEQGCEVLPVFFAREGPGAALRTRIARWLFYGFLRRDIQILQGMRFRPRLLLPYDEALGTYLDFVREQCGVKQERASLKVI